MTLSEYNEFKNEGFDFDDKEALEKMRVAKDYAYVEKQKQMEAERYEMAKKMNYVVDPEKEKKIIQEREFRSRQRADELEKVFKERRAQGAPAFKERPKPGANIEL